LVNILLRGERTLSRGETELIATHVSRRNNCSFCQTIHGAVSAAQVDSGEALVEKVKTDWLTADVSPRLKALLNIGGKVQEDGGLVTSQDVAAARQEGATDREIHEAVLISAVFWSAYAIGGATGPLLVGGYLIVWGPYSPLTIQLQALPAFIPLPAHVSAASLRRSECTTRKPSDENYSKNSSGNHYEG